MNISNSNNSAKPKKREILNKNIKNSTIMSDIFKSILLTAFISLIILMCFLGYYVYQENIKYSVSILDEETNSVSAEIDHYFKDILTTIDVLSYYPVLQKTKITKDHQQMIQNILKKIEPENQIINRIFIAFEDNNLLINDTIFPENYNFKEANWYSNAIKTSDRTFSIDDIPSAEKEFNPKFIISKSFAENGKNLGVIAVDCQLDSLYISFLPKSIFQTKKVMLANAKDAIVLSQTPDEIDRYILTNHPEMFNENKTAFPIHFEGEKYQVVSHQLADSDWSVISRINYTEITSRIIFRSIFFGLCMLILTYIVAKALGYVLGNTIAKPVVQVSYALKSLAKGNRDVEPIHDYPQNEIGTMADSFNTFLKTTKMLKSDIFELQDTKKKLSYSLSLLNASLESTDDGILIVNNKGEVTKWNNRFLEIWELSEDSMRSFINDKYMPEIKEKIVDFSTFYEKILEVRENPELVTTDIVEFVNGKIIERYSFPQRVDDEIVGRVWRYRDITKIRESEILLQDSEERHRVMFTQTVEAYTILDDGVCIDANQVALDMVKAPKGWLIGKTLLDISPKYQADGSLSSELAKEHFRLADEKGKHTFTWINTRYDGTEFPTEITLVKIKLKEKDLMLVIWKDVTEERKIQEQLRLNEQNFRHFFESMLDMIFVTDYQGNIKYVNKAIKEKLGYSFSELTSMTVLDIHKSVGNSDSSVIMKRLMSGDGGECSTPLKTKEGKLIAVESKTWFGKWNGEDSIFGVSKDISNEQEALLKFNRVFENNPALMAISRFPERTYLNVNNSFCKALGFTKEEVIGKTSDELGISRDLALVDENIDKLIKTGGFTNVQMRISTKNGEMLDGLFSGEMIETDGNKFFLTVMTNITDMKKLDRELSETNRKYRLLFENMTAGFALHEMIYDEDGNPVDYRFLDVNPAFEQFTGVKSSELIGKTVKEVFPLTEQYWIDTYGKVALTGESLNYEQYSKGLNKYFEVKAFSTEPNRFATIFYDSTSQVKALKELEREKELAQTATKAKSEFLANMSHEIRTPLNGVIGFTDLLLSTDLTTTQKQFAINANVSGKALLGIISDILDFSKIEAGKMELDLVNSSVSQVLEQAVDIVKFSASKKGLDVLLNIPVDFPAKAIVDPLRLKQIVLNLLNNAVKFTDKGEIELFAKFIPYDDKAGKFIFSVKDTGVGISDSSSDRLFKAFSQADGSITRKYGGTGLGLVISNYFASKMGSHIDFVSEEGKGSEFYFAINTEYVENTKSRKDVFKGKSVLLADKNEKYLEINTNRLSFWGLNVTKVRSYDSLITKLSATKYDVILLDERLITNQDYDKFNNLVSANSEGKQAKLIITYYPNVNVEVIELAKLINASAMLTKPLISEDLFQSLDGLCSKNATVKNNIEPAKKSIIKIETVKLIKVLIAEDVEMNMILVKTLIKKIIPNVKIYEAKNGMEAVYHYKQHSPDIILMDIQMPELDGIEATKAIRNLKDKSNVPIIALTAGAFSDDKEKCLKAGMVDFLTKPINVKELAEKLAKYLNKSTEINK